MNWKPQTAKGSPSTGVLIAKKNFLEIIEILGIIESITVVFVYSVWGGGEDWGEGGKEVKCHHLYRLISITFPYSLLCTCLPLALKV